MTNVGGRRAPACAGQFYPAAVDRLQAAVDRHLDSAHHAPGPEESIRAIVAPHAGYQFSGDTAGKAYALVRGRTDYNRAVVLAPSHRVPFRGVSVGDYESFATPLGDLQVDVGVCESAAASSRLVSRRRDAHADEHALEVQLPFLQTVLPDITLVPVVCGRLSLAEVRSVAAELAPLLWRPDTLWVVSTDFTHFGRAFGYVPFTRDVPARLEELDRGAISHVVEIDCEGFFGYVEETGATICGRVPLALLLAVLETEPGAYTCRLVDYTTSGARTQDYEHCVSYASLVVAEESEDAEGEVSAEGAGLSVTDKENLLALAREAIRADLSGASPRVPDAVLASEACTAVAPCFVTLREDGDLRGCIGSLTSSESLYENVIQNACSAASQDPRFWPLAEAELDRVSIGISVLTPARPVASWEEIVVGRHGVILEKGGCDAVFLPQVAVEQGWDVETTLTHLSRKAGLRADEWRRGATFKVFEAVVFRETDGPEAGA